MTTSNKLKFALFFTRVSILLVLLIWTVDKFINPGHTAKVLENFYAMPGLSATLSSAIGAAELILLILVFLGIKKTLTYGIVLLIHASSTFVSFGNYLAPYEGANILFFAAWPMLAACVLLFILRDKDTLLQIPSKSKSEL